MDSGARLPMFERELHCFLDCNLQQVTVVFCASFHFF